MLKPASIVALGFIGLALSACQDVPETTVDEAVSSRSAETGAATLARAVLSDAAGTNIGSVVIASVDERLTIILNGNGLEPGEKAFHLHTTGACEAPDFTSAQGHLNPFGKTHGSQSEGGKHLGDLPNITVGVDSSFEAEFTLEEPLSEVEQYLFDEDGTAVMIHAGPDDYVTDPTGNAGGRIACGVLERVAAE